MRKWLSFLAVVLLVSPVCLPANAEDLNILVAQEEAEAPDETASAGEIYLEAEVWVAQPSGLEYEPATRINPSEDLSNDLLVVGHGTEPEERFDPGDVDGDVGHLGAEP